MHAHCLCLILFLCTATILAATIEQIVFNNKNLIQNAVAVDITVVALVPESGFQAARQVTRDLNSLTRAIVTAGYNDTSTITEPTSDPALETTVTRSYGLFTNIAQELMYDLYGKENILASYYQQNAIYRQMQYFNTTLVAYSNYLYGVVGDALHQVLIFNATANALVAIANATDKYTPGQMALLFKA